MSVAAEAVLARAGAAGVSLTLGWGADGCPCVVWRGPKGAMTEELRAALWAAKTDLVGHLRAERKADVTPAFAPAYARLGEVYPNADDAGLREVGRRLPDLFVGVERLEFETGVVAVACLEGRRGRQSFESALAAWKCGEVDAVAALASVRGGKTCSDCGAEAPVTVVTSLGQRLCSRCARADSGRTSQNAPRRRPRP